MKNNTLITTIIALFLSATVITGCSDDDDHDHDEMKSLKFHLHTMVGSTAANYTATFQDASGRKFNIADFRYYISNIILIKDDGSEYPITGKVFLADPATHDYPLGDVPVGSYKGFKFYLGIDSLTNHSDPTAYPEGNPLAIQTPGIHWSWNSGYIFMKVEGFVDTTMAANGTTDFEYFYHIGMDMLKRNIDFSNTPFTVASGSDNEIVMEFDLLTMLTNVDMRTENMTHTMDNMPLAVKIANNWQSAFNVE
jgi:hypothetical protein